jgi:cobalt/nickel transport system permease protein
MDSNTRTIQVPEWMLGVPSAPPPGRQRRPTLEKLLNGVAHVVEAAMAADASSRRHGLLQRIDPRLKLVGLLALLLASVLVSHLAALLALLAIAVAFVVVSRLGLGRFALRAWLFIPLFTLAITVPAMTTWVTPGPHLVPLWSGGAITTTGLASSLHLVLRVLDAVSFSVLLAMTTPWNELLAALRVLRVPRTFVFILAISYRYVFVLMRLIQGMVTARRSRTVGRLTPREDRRFVAAAVGTLFGHSQAMSEEVHTAMLARGFTGQVHTLHAWRLHRLDYLWALAVAVALAAVIALQATVTRGL